MKLAIAQFGRYWLDIGMRRRTRRDRRLTLGNALVGGLRRALLDRNVPVWLDTPMRDLLDVDGRVTGVRAALRAAGDDHRAAWRDPRRGRLRAQPADARALPAAADAGAVERDAAGQHRRRDRRRPPARRRAGADDARVGRADGRCRGRGEAARAVRRAQPAGLRDREPPRQALRQRSRAVFRIRAGDVSRPCAHRRERAGVDGVRRAVSPQVSVRADHAGVDDARFTDSGRVPRRDREGRRSTRSPRASASTRLACTTRCATWRVMRQPGSTRRSARATTCSTRTTAIRGTSRTRASGRSTRRRSTRCGSTRATSARRALRHRRARPRAARRRRADRRLYAIGNTSASMMGASYPARADARSGDDLRVSRRRPSGCSRGRRRRAARPAFHD